MDTAIIALIGTVFGGMGLKIIEHVLGRGVKREDLAAGLRAELRADIERLRIDLREEAASAEEWQEKYWALRSSTMIANHKVDRVVEVVDSKHPEAGLGDELEALKETDK